MKKFLCMSLAALTMFLAASCTPIERQSSEVLESGEVSVGDISVGDISVGDVSQSETSEDENSSTSDYDTELVIPTTITSNEVDFFFNDSIFVGNSIMLKYEKFVNKYRASSVSDFLGNSKFFCAGSFGVYHNNHTPASSSGAVNPSYQGTKYSVQDMVGVANPKRVFLNLAGLNDMGIYSSGDICASETAKEMIKLLSDLESQYPDVEVVVLSTTYLIKEMNYMPRLNNENLSIMNNLVLEYCNENGIDFVDISSLLNDENGCLNGDYCSDPNDGGCHLNDSGCLVWTGLLRNYAAKKLTGTYENPESMPTLSKD